MRRIACHVSLLTSVSLRDEDRDRVRSAASKVSAYALIGSLAGLALGSWLAFRLRANQRAMYQAFRASEKPTHVKFASGREEAVPDVTQLLKPTQFENVMTYTLCGLGGIFLGGETGLLTGSWSAKRTISRNPDSRERIEKAFRLFRVDVLRKQINDLNAAKINGIWS